MRTIADYSEVPKYSIKSVCAQTGIRAVTLRAWERRHALLSPHRQDNRYRQYSDRDIAILSWVKNRVDSGITISRAVYELHSMENKGIFPEVVSAFPTPVEERADPSRSPDEYTALLYQALTTHNEIVAGEIYHEMHASYDLQTIISRVLIPCLAQIGDAWYNGRIRITTEHFATAFIRSRLYSVYQSFPTRRKAVHLLVGCAPTEQHEIGSLMLAVLLRSKGFRVEYLGPDLPIDDLVDYARQEHPKMLILSASLQEAGLEMLSVQEKLQAFHPPVLFGYGGRAFTNDPALREKVPGFYLGDSLEQALETVHALFERSSQKTGR